MTTTNQTQASIADYVILARPKQWAKNILVLAAPFAAGVLDQTQAIATVIAGVVAFSIVSSAMYAINDAADYEADRHHPRKQHRPVASGRIAPSSALTFGAVLLIAGLALAIAIGSAAFTLVLATYGAITIAYSIWLKQVALLDIVVIAIGFVLRAIGGAVLVDVPISNWFIIVVAFAALFIAAGKRFGERAELEGGGHSHRMALADYAPGFIEFLLGVSATVVVLAYSLWGFEIQDTAGSVPWAVISIAPFVVGLLRYAQLIFLGRGGEPEQVLFSDRGIQVIGFIWVLTVAVWFYGGGT